MESQFTSPQVQSVLGVGREVFRSWVNAGFIKPSIQRSTQQGEQNLFDRLDVYGAGLFKHLTTSLKMKRQEAGYHVAVWRDRVKAIPTKPKVAAGLYNMLVFIRRGEDIVACQDFSILGTTHPFAHLIGELENQVEGESWSDMLIVNMREIVEGIEQKLSRIAR